MHPELHELIEKHVHIKLENIPEKNLTKTHIHSLTYFASLAAKNSRPSNRVTLLLAHRIAEESCMITLNSVVKFSHTLVKLPPASKAALNPGVFNVLASKLLEMKEIREFGKGNMGDDSSGSVVLSILIEGVYGGRFFGPFDENMKRLSIMLEEALLSIYGGDAPVAPSITANMLRALKSTPFPRNTQSSPYEIDSSVPLVILYNLRKYATEQKQQKRSLSRSPRDTFNMIYALKLYIFEEKHKQNKKTDFIG